MEKNITRRDFLKVSGAGALALGAAAACGPKKAGVSALQTGDGEMEYRTDPHGNKISLLGYGCMRWPMIKDADGRDIVDQEKVDELIDYAMAHGVNYYDSAPVYLQGQSEAATGKSLSRYPRDKYYVATKLSTQRQSSWDFDSSKKMYEKSFRELRVDYIDYYLLHSIGGGGVDGLRARFLDNGVLDFLLREREAGRIRHLGFSYHGDVSAFDFLLDHQDEYHWDFAQIQMNYLDWRHASLNKGGWRRDADAEYLYDKLEKTGVQTVVMEPLRGGALARMRKDLAQRLTALRPNDSLASWAFRWVGSHPNILTTLSGMNEMSHMVDNVRTFSPLDPCTEAENHLLEEIADVMAGFPVIPCTTCAYCMPCPYGVDIPGNFSFYNEAVNNHLLPLPEPTASDYAERQQRFMTDYREAIPAESRANQCVDCEACLPKCPQQIRIPNQMGRIVSLLRHNKK